MKGLTMVTTKLKQLTIDFIESMVLQKTCFCVENQGGDLFQHPTSEDGIPENSLLIDVQSANVLCIVHKGLNTKNQANFNNILQDEYKFASLLDKMWDWVSLKRN